MEHQKGEFVECATEQAEKRKCFNVREIISQAVELPLFLSMLAVSVQGIPISNLVMYRTCVHTLNYTVDDCQSFLSTSSIDHSNELENEVQKYANNVKTVESAIKAVGPAVLALFIGVWSDKHGRKPLIFCPLFGNFISAIITVLFSMLEFLGPWWILVPAVPASVLGGGIIVTGALCFSSDVSNEENRSLRLLILVLTIVVAVSAGGMISPFLLRAVGNNWLLFLVAMCYFVGFLYALFCLKESLPEAVKGTILTIFNCSHPKEMMRYCFMKKPNYVRAIVLFTIAASSLAMFAEYGVISFGYMYARTKIQWSMTQYSIFGAISAVWSFTGSLLGIALLQRWLKVSDLNFVSIALIFCCIEFIIKGLATTTWHMYLGGAVSIFGAVVVPLLRAFLTKSVARTDTAKVVGLLGFTDCFSPLLAPLVYNAVYTVTIDTFPGAIMFLTALTNFTCLVLVLIVRRLKWRVDSRQLEAKLEGKA